MARKNPWLKSAWFDSVFIFSPALIAITIAFILQNKINNSDKFPLWAWVIFVMCIDVSHVYSTLYRTYFNADEFKTNKNLYTLIPIGAWLAGVLVYSYDGFLFWRLLTYVAVFHFVRQQYGFLKLYTRNEIKSAYQKNLEQSLIYLATIYPLMFWHTNQPRNFHWFIEGDFIISIPSDLTTAVGWAYLLLLGLYVTQEIYNLAQNNFNTPKNLILISTALSWYFGIVYFNSDMIFTMTNVVAHGIPYMALIWIYGEKQKNRASKKIILNYFSYKTFFSWWSVPLFIGVLLVLAYVEESLWSGLVWRDHLAVFNFASSWSQITAKDTLTWLVPLLAVPQATHYILDGFIWKLKEDKADWQKVLFNS